MEFTFDDFRKRATDKRLSKWEKIGFPDSYRSGVEKLIFQDICNKTDMNKAATILDIGCGCSELVDYFVAMANENKQALFLVDSAEMLENISNASITDYVHLIPGRFPDKEVLAKLEEASFDVIVVYSVIQYVFIDQSIFGFIHECIRLLKSGGRLLIGDIPNFQARERFLDSNEGKAFAANLHQTNNGINILHENAERIDDSVIMSILLRYRQFGCETYLLKQNNNLPFSNRREDILIIKR